RPAARSSFPTRRSSDLHPAVAAGLGSAGERLATLAVNAAADSVKLLPTSRVLLRPPRRIKRAMINTPSLRHLLQWATAVVLSTWSSTLALAETVDSNRFERTVVHSGLIQPMELDIAADGRIFVIELGGTLKRIDPHSGQATVVGQLEVTTAQENGLIGLALDPNFLQNGWIYLQYSPPDFSGQYVSRFDFRDDQLDLASEKRLFSYEEQ